VVVVLGIFHTLKTSRCCPCCSSHGWTERRKARFQRRGAM
jgi:hypothetical protein